LYFISTLNGEEFSASRLGRFTVWKRVPGIHCVEIWCVPELVVTSWTRENVLIPAEKRKIELNKIIAENRRHKTNSKDG
jgi:hypothetical protein